MASDRIIMTTFLSVLLFAIHTGTVAAELVLEAGYTVTTLIDGHKLRLNPHSILPRPTSSDYVILDSTNSAFYSVSAPISQESVIRRLAGNGSSGFVDGGLETAMFNKSRSFAVDVKGNVYVADKSNHVIRKISSTGVSTIAGGNSRKVGYGDGPAQDALFSYDFELTFVPGMCALLISDQGNMRVRQIDLKREDCRVGSRSVLGATLTWIIGLGTSCIIGLIMGFVARPYITARQGSQILSLMQMWNLYRINLGKQVATSCCDIKSAIANSTPYLLLKSFVLLILSYFSLLLSFYILNPVRSSRVESISLLGSEVDSSIPELKPLVLDKFANQLKELITYEGISENSPALPNPANGDGDVNKVTVGSDSSSDNQGTLETMIHANLMDFTAAARAIPEPEVCELVSSGLVKRR